MLPGRGASVFGLAPMERVAGEVAERQQERRPEGELVGGQEEDKPQRDRPGRRRLDITSAQDT